MCAAVVLCRQSQSESVLGIAAAQNGSRLLISVQGDGVVSYSISRMVLDDTCVLGSSKAKLLAPVQQLGSSYIAAVQPHGSSHGLLVCTPVKEKQRTPMLDAKQQIPLPLPLHSCHILQVAGHHSSGCAAVVFHDGTVGAADFTSLTIRSGSTGIHNSSAGPRGQVEGTIVSAADSSGQLLAVAHQASAGADVHVDVYAAGSCNGQDAAEVDPTLQLVHSCTVASVTGSSRLSHLSVEAGMLALVWRDGRITAYHSSFAAKDNCAEHTREISIPPAVAVVISGQQSVSRKRRPAEDAAPLPQLMCTAVSSTQLLLVSVRSASQVHYAVVDSRYGCCLASGPVMVEDAGSTAETGCTAELVALGSTAAAPAALRVGGSVYLLQLQLRKADLAGLVSMLAVSHTPEPATAAAVSNVLTWRQQINLTEMAAVATHQQQVCGFQRVPAAAVCGAEGDGLPAGTASAQRLAAVVAQQPVPALELLQAAQHLVVALQEQAMQITQQGQQKPAGRRVQQQAGGPWGQPEQPTAAALVSQRVLAQGLAALADVAEWKVLQQLHQLQPLQSLAACPTLLPSLAAAQQYQLMRQVLLNAQEVAADSLVSAMQHLLQQPSNSLMARQAEGAAVRQVAAAAVQEAEKAVAAGADVAAGPLLGVACRAAAAVDGFTATEVLLHAMLAAPVDAAEVQAALKRLSTQLVLKLLRYLDKWVQKYTSLPLNAVPTASSWAEFGLVGCPWDSTHALALLAIPSWDQVVVWARLVLDAHLTTLAVLPAATVLLQRIKQALQQEAGASSVLVSLKGVADHMAMGAPLPVVAEAANSEYTLELLDLRVAGRS